MIRYWDLRSRRLITGNGTRTARFSKSTASCRSYSSTHQLEDISMYDRLGLRVKNLDASIRFYERTLGALGHVLVSCDATYAGFGPAGAAALWLYPSKEKVLTGSHIAFRAGSRAAVDKFHAEGLKAGGRDNGAPGVRTDYSPTYYAAFLIDFDGNNVEAVFTG